jgi:hypothetical protein
VSVIRAAPTYALCHGDPEFERHIEASQIGTALSLAPRRIVNRIFGRPESVHDPLHAWYRDAAGFDSAAREKPAADRREHDRIEGRAKLRIERAVDENGTVTFE